MNNGQLLFCILALVGAFLFTVVAERVLIPILRRKRAGQPILEIGPVWHLSKAGTPTMGGLGFAVGIGAALLLGAMLLWRQGENKALRPLALLFLYATLCGAIGLVDDWKKLSKKKNQGLSAAQKYALQLLASGIFLYLSTVLLGVERTVILPFSGRELSLGMFYYPLALIYLTGLVNALNLTDGVDGLLSSTVAVAALCFFVFGLYRESFTSAALGCLLLGGVLGFFCFNAHPARVFMGDTGSLFLGGAVAGLGIVTGNALFVLAVSGVFVWEALSVILQVIFFRVRRGKRLFLMAPFHHHLEKKGVGEWGVVGIFTLSAAAFAALALWGWM